MSQRKRQFLDWVDRQAQLPDLARMAEDYAEQAMSSEEPTVKGNQIIRRSHESVKPINH